MASINTIANFKKEFQSDGITFTVKYSTKAALNRMEKFTPSNYRKMYDQKKVENGTIKEPESLEVMESLDEPLKLFAEACTLLSKDDVLGAVLETAEKKKNGLLAVKRIQVLFIFPYINSSDEYYEVVAKNNSDTEMEILIRKKSSFHHHYGDDDNIKDFIKAYAGKTSSFAVV